MRELFLFSHCSSPSDFPGKNTGVGGHFLLQGILGIELESPVLADISFTIEPLGKPRMKE